ncbi:MAG TPA: DMT family transporter [Jatrophihabitans sp.]|nr:DMT family transporter [Jatrophihabitans sp.]
MSLTVAIPLGVSSAVVYGTSIVVQHRMAQHHSDDNARASAAGLLRLVRSPLWLLSMLGDFFGFVLQIAALSAGPVVVIQPLVVLMLPVALIVSAVLGWHRPRAGDYFGVAAVLGGLGVFLGLIGNPGAVHLPKPHTLAETTAIVALAGVAACVVVTGRNHIVRGAVYGGVAGVYFGGLAVMVDAAADQASQAGLHGLFATPRGLVPLIGGLLLGVGGMALTQMSFQVGSLSATLPVNLAADPLTAVVLGVAVLHERIPVSPAHIVAYVLCLAAVVAGAIRLADPKAGPINPDERLE